MTTIHGVAKSQTRLNMYTDIQHIHAHAHNTYTYMHTCTHTYTHTYTHTRRQKVGPTQAN